MLVTRPPGSVNYLIQMNNFYWPKGALSAIQSAPRALRHRPTRQLFLIEIARRAVEAVAVRVEPDARPVEKMGAVFGKGAALEHDVARGHDMVAAGFTGGG